MTLLLSWLKSQDSSDTADYLTRACVCVCFLCVFIVMGKQIKPKKKQRLSLFNGAGIVKQI